MKQIYVLCSLISVLCSLSHAVTTNYLTVANGTTNALLFVAPPCPGTNCPPCPPPVTNCTTTVYVTNCTYTQTVYNCTNPCPPCVTNCPPCPPAGGSAPFPSGLLIADERLGIVTMTTNLTVLGAPSTFSSGYNIAVDGHRAIVTGNRTFHSPACASQQQAGMWIYNTSNAVPVLVGSVITTETLNDCVLAGDYAYVACGSVGVKVFNLSNPAAPTLAGSYDTPGQAWSVRIVGNVLYVADGTVGVRILNVSNPAAITSTGSLATPTAVRDVAVVGTMVYAAGGGGLHVIDAGNPAAPALLGSYTSGYPFSPLKVRVANNVAYVAASSGGLWTFNVSNPASPVKLGSIASCGSSSAATLGVAVAGNIAYVANGAGGLHVVNISNPSAPMLVNSVVSAGDVKSIAVK